MDWSNNQYVRVYIGDSRDWISFGWEARALFVELLRCTDRAGLLDFAGDDDIPVLADMVRMPVEVVARALPRIVARGSVVLRDGRLVIPNKLEAQESAQSGKQRTKEFRARARAIRRAAALGVTERHADVTERHADVTVGNVETQSVTSRNTELKQSRAKTELKQSRAEDLVAIVTPLKRRRLKLKKTQLDVAVALMSDGPLVSKWERGIEPIPEGYLQRWREMLSKWEGSEPGSEHAQLRAHFEQAFGAFSDGAKYVWAAKDGHNCKLILDGLGLEVAMQRVSYLFAHAATGFPKRPTLQTLAGNLNGFASPPPKPKRPEQPPQGGSSPESHRQSRILETERRRQIDLRLAGEPSQ